MAIVGAGLTGLWAAYALRRLAPHRSVTVLEAEHVGFGASGRNGGWLSHLVPGNRARSPPDRAGIAGAARLQAAMVAAIDEVLAAWPARASTPTCTGAATWCRDHPGRPAPAAPGPGGRPALRPAPRAVRAAGRRRTRERIDVHGAVGGLLHPMVVRIHPAKLVTGLAAAVERQGAVIHERTRALASSPGRVRTDRGELRAGMVLICIEGYGGPLLGRRSIIPVNSSMIVTEPLAGRDWARIGWAGRECLSDAAHTYIYAQRTADDRIAIGGGAGRTATTPGSPRAVRRTPAPCGSCWPGCTRSSPRWRSRWPTPGPGVLGVTRDWCATVRFDPERGLGVAAGYAGHGVTAAYLAGAPWPTWCLAASRSWSSCPGSITAARRGSRSRCAGWACTACTGCSGWPTGGRSGGGRSAPR